MYQQQGLQESLYLLLYGATMMFAVLSCLYLLLRPRNFIQESEPPVALRRWTAAFLCADALSHVWWVVIGPIVLTDDQFLRNAINIGLDSVTLVPLMMITLLRMLQDRKRRLWPVCVAMVPVVVVMVGLGIISRNEVYEDFLRNYLLALAVAFVGYITHAVRQYGRWLRENYADLEHKEVWQSMVLLLVILLMFGCYKTNFGGMLSEYAVQVNTLVLIAFLVWRVETLQRLDDAKDEPNGSDTSDIILLLKTECEDTELYLRHDLTLTQMATALGTNRTYLSSWFSMQGESYSTYINRLRIDHFCRLCRETGDGVTIQDLATRCGYGSYSTFIANFKRFKGMTVKAWTEKEGLRSIILRAERRRVSNSAAES